MSSCTAISIVRGLLACCFLSIVVGCGCAFAAEPVTIVGWGGVYQDALRQAVYQPAAKAAGVTFREETLNGIADVRAQSLSGKPTWDIVEIGSNECAAAEAEGLFEPLDYSKIDVSGFPKELIGRTWIGSVFVSTLIAWNKDKFGENGPRDWKDFWDVKRFPGTRSLYHRPTFVLEAALLADGVDPGKLYPLDVDRAFRKLQKLKPMVSVWWSSGGQAAQLVADNEVDVIMIWNGRIEDVIKSGAHWGYTYDHALLDYNCFGIMKGAPHAAAARRMLAEMVKPEVMANIPKYINYGPANLKAFDTLKLSPAQRASINSTPENVARQILFSAAWWMKYETPVTERYQEFIQ